MNVQTKPSPDSQTPPPIVAALGRRARQAAASAAQRHHCRQEQGAGRRRAPDPRRERRHPGRQCARHRHAAKAAGMSEALQDRLLLNAARIEGMATALDDIAALPDPVGSVVEQWQRPNGLAFSRVRVPIGIIGVIYEARPNVTADAGALCLKSGNVVVLRGGSDSFHSSRASSTCCAARWAPPPCRKIASSSCRPPTAPLVGEMLKAMDWLDLIVPRGGRSLIDRVTAESRVPVLRHYDGLCHVYVDRDADIDDGARHRGQRQDAPGQRLRRRRNPADRPRRARHASQADRRPGCSISAAKCAATARCRSAIGRVLPATEKDWRTEYLDADHLGRRRRWRRGRGAPHRDLRQPAHRFDRHRQRGDRRALPAAKSTAPS